MGTASLENLSSIVSLAKTGNKDAVSRLIEVTQDKFYRFIYYISGDSQIAQDICQDAYIKVLENLTKLKNDHGFLTWLYKIGKNLFLDHIKQKVNQSESFNEQNEDSLGDFLQHPINIDDVMQIKQELQSLIPEERIVLLLIDMEGYSYAEAAQVLGITEHSVRMKLHRARKQFVFNFIETSKSHQSSVK